MELMKHKLLLFFMILSITTSAAWAQQQTVSGKVTDAGDGLGLPGVNIIEAGTNNGTVTDVDGNYKLKVASDATLIFSYVGYTTSEVAVNGRAVVDVPMDADITQLAEVVVVGYGSQEKGDVTGVVAKVDEESFNKGAIVSPDQLIAGKVAGVQITPNSGEPGGQSKIRIRGGTSITASNEPLYVIDGVPIESNPHDPGGFSKGRNPLNFINSNDIESITILKDASAAAIYGSRAANGVVIINTKRGGKGGRVSYSGYFSIAEMSREVDMLEREPFVNVVTAKSPQRLQTLGTADTDWSDEILQTAIGQNHNLSFSGGTESSAFRVSLGHQDIDGIVKTSNTRRTSLSVNYNQSFWDDRIAVDASIKAAYTKDRFNPDVIGASLTYDPTQPVYDESNEALGGYFEYPLSSLGPDNPVSNLEQTQDIGEYLRNVGNVSLTYNSKLLPGFSVTSNFGFDLTNGERKRLKLTSLRNAALDSGEVRYEALKKINPLFNVFGRYERYIESINSKFDLTAGYEYQDFGSDYQGYRAYRLANDVYGFYGAQVAGKIEPIASNEENRLISFFGRLNYTFNDKYLLTASLRRDGSARFASENRWGWFPSVALGWRLIEEDFMSGLTNIFSDLKLRAGYGVTGSQEIGNYKYLATYTSSKNNAQYQFGDRFITTLRPNGYDNQIKWEETSSYNLGLDFEVLEGRYSGSLEFYVKDTKDLLFEVSVPAGTNLTNRVISNIGAMQNKGVELSLGGYVIDKADFKWNAGVNVAYNSNTIKGLDLVNDPAFEGYLVGDISGGVGNKIQILRLNETINSFYVYKHKTDDDGNPLVDGIDHNEDGTIDLADIYKDTNGDEIVNSEDRTPYKKPAPDVLLGFNSTFTYKSLDLSFTMRANLGNYVYNNIASANGAYSGLSSGSGFVSNLHSSVLETGFANPQYFSDYYVENASFLKLDNITLGYNFSKLSGLNLRVYTTAQNLFVLTNYSGLDPEVDNGIDNNPYPRSRTFLVGVNIEF